MNSIQTGVNNINPFLCFIWIDIENIPHIDYLLLDPGVSFSSNVQDNLLVFNCSLLLNLEIILHIVKV